MMRFVLVLISCFLSLHVLAMQIPCSGISFRPLDCYHGYLVIMSQDLDDSHEKQKIHEAAVKAFRTAMKETIDRNWLRIMLKPVTLSARLELQEQNKVVLPEGSGFWTLIQVVFCHPGGAPLAFETALFEINEKIMTAFLGSRLYTTPFTPMLFPETTREIEMEALDDAVSKFIDLYPGGESLFFLIHDSVQIEKKIEWFEEGYRHVARASFTMLAWPYAMLSQLPI